MMEKITEIMKKRKKVILSSLHLLKRTAKNFGKQDLATEAQNTIKEIQSV